MSRFSRFSARPRARKLAAIVPVVVIGISLATAPTASAHHSEISATANCNGIVKFTSKSWSTGKQGENSNIGISFAVGNSAFTTVTPSTGVKYEFTAANKYTFSDSFKVDNSKGGLSVTVKSKPLANWGSGATPSGEATTKVSVPAYCAPTTTTQKPTTTTQKQTTTTVKQTTTTQKPTTTVKQTTTTNKTNETTSTTVKKHETTTTVPKTTTTLEDEVAGTTIVQDPTTTVPELPVVLDNQVIQGELADTGADVMPMSMLGLVLILLGGVMVIFGHPAITAFRRRQR
jgi:hypothetical protein